MTKPFPLREWGVLGAAELVSRVLGLLFLAHFIAKVGIVESAGLRILLPLIGVAAAFGSIGLPQAVTRLLAVRATDGPVPRSCLRAVLLATVCACAGTLALLAAVGSLASAGANNGAALLLLFEAAAPLLLLMCVTGTLRGLLFGLGSTYGPALAQVLEVGTRLAALLWALPLLGASDSALTGIWTMMIGEAAAGSLLALLLWKILSRRETSQLPTGPRAGRDFLTLMRMSFAPTGQALLASLGYALELPLAQEWLSRTHGGETALHAIAEYSAVAIPLLCAPMVVTDGMATALLPHAASERAKHGTRVWSVQVRRTLGAVAMVALPVTGGMIVLAPLLTSWFGTPGAAPLLAMLAPLILPLYLQMPLSSLLQAGGRSRALLAAGLCGDAARLGALWLALGPLGLGREGLLAAFAASVLTQTTVLLLMARTLAPLPIPWRTFGDALQAALSVSALLLLGLHAPAPFALQGQPLLWLALTLLLLLLHLRLTNTLPARKKTSP